METGQIKILLAEDDLNLGKILKSYLELKGYKTNLYPGRVALKKIWLDDTYYNARSMDVYISKLRNYLKYDKNVGIINVHGFGFRLVEGLKENDEK